MSRKNREYDQNIIAALKRLPVPLKTARGSEVFFDANKRYETIYEHIANKCHHLHTSDIEMIPRILKDPNSLMKDYKSRKYRNYIGRRGKKGEKTKYIKIITEIKKGNKESIVTIYTIRKMID